MEKIQKKLIIFMPSMEGGGVEKNIIIISNYLAKKFDRIKLITFDKKFKKKFSKKINIINISNKILKINKYYKYAACLLVLLKFILENKNIVIFAFQANIYCIIIAKIFGVDIVTRSNSSPTGWTKNYFKNLIFKYFFQYPHSVIVNSKDFKREFDKLFNINTKLIYNPLNKNEIIKLAKKKVSLKFLNEKKNLKLINVARFTDQKDQLTLLKAFKEIYLKISCRLLLVGYGSNKTILKNFIKLNNLNKFVKIINYKDNPYKYISRSDMFILTSKYEGLPNVLLEAMTLKKTIISSNCPTGPKEILNNGKFGFLFTVGNYQQLAKKIIFCSKNKKITRIKINKGYQSLKRFDYEINCYKYYKILKEIL